MTDINTLLRNAIDDEPPMQLQPADVIRRGRASRRRTRVTVGAAASVGVLGAAAVAVTIASMATSQPQHRTGTASIGHLTAAADQHHATSKQQKEAASGAHVGAITADNLPGLVQQSIGVDLVDAQVSPLAPSGDLDLAAGIAVNGHPYLNVQVVPPGNIDAASESCADLNVLASPDSDGYTGPCSVQTLSDGSVLIVRSGETTTGGYTKAQADLILPDGTAILAEDTNQSGWPTRPNGDLVVKVSHGQKVLPPVVSAQPPLDSSVMSKLVQDLAAAES